jgi:hypothetical protein
MPTFGIFRKTASASKPTYLFADGTTFQLQKVRILAANGSAAPVKITGWDKRYDDDDHRRGMISWRNADGSPVPPGNYSLVTLTADLNVRTLATVTVVADVALNFTTSVEPAGSGADTGNIQKAVSTVAANGGGAVVLEPGYYTINHAIQIPSNVEIRAQSPGLVTLGRRFTDPTEYNNKMFDVSGPAGSPVANVALTNLRCVSEDGRPFTLIHGSPADAVNSSISNCDFVGYEVEARCIGEGNVIQDCRFDRATLYVSGGVMATRLRFNDVVFQNPLRLFGDQLILHDCVFTRCQGPIVVQGWSGNVTHSLLSMLTFEEIEWANNRCECINVEEGEMNNCLLTGLRYHNCTGPLIEIYSGGFNGNTIIDLYANGGSSSGLFFLNPAKRNVTVNNNLFQFVEIHDCNQFIRMETASNNNVFDQCALIHQIPHRSHEFDIQLGTYDVPATPPLYCVNGRANVLQNSVLSVSGHAVTPDTVAQLAPGFDLKGIRFVG